MAHPAGFEPTAYRLGGGRSILLSYGCKRFAIIPRREEKHNMTGEISCGRRSFYGVYPLATGRACMVY